MDATILAVITIGCTFGCALGATYLRKALPPHHFSKETQDIVRLGMGLVATMTAVLPGIVTASARSAFDEHDVEVKNSAVNVLTLDRQLARYGEETRPNATVVVLLFVAALSMAAAIFLIVELDGPFDAWIRVSGEPLRFALRNLGQ